MDYAHYPETSGATKEQAQELLDAHASGEITLDPEMLQIAIRTARGDEQE